MKDVSENILAALDDDQRAVATQLERPLVVLAGAGSGKTRAITHRVAHAVSVGAYDPRATLAVTFTTRAAGEMRMRLARLGVRQASARTIHSAALRQCQYFWPRVYKSEFPEVAESTFAFTARAASGVLGNADTALIRDLETEITWAKSSNVAPERYAELSGDRSVSGASPAQVGAVFAAYEKSKTAAGRVDFHDILLCAAHLMADHPEVAAEITGTYRHFVVDEYQDVSAIQHRLIDLWVDGRGDFCVVGDPRQSIHGFAGADASHLEALARRDDTAVIELRRNYRSTPQVCRVGNQVLGLGRSGGLVASRPAGEEVLVAEETTESGEAHEVAGWFRSLRSQGVPWDEMAALYRINSQSAQLEAALTQAGIPYTVRGTERFYDRAEIRQAILLLTKALEADPAAQVSAVLDGVSQSMGWTPEPPTGAGRQRERWESIAALREMILTQGPETPSELVTWLGERAAWQAAPVAAAVTLSSMHASKGLEWDAVAVIGLREGLVPFSLAQEEPALSEERRLLHVAVTRARDRLRLSWPAGENSRGRASRFLTPVLGSRGAPTPKSAPRKRGARRCTVCGKPVASAVEKKLGRHLDCESDVDPALFDALKAWRKDTADEAKVPAFVVFTDATLLAIAEARPTTEQQLLTLPGIGAVKMERYGLACLEIVRGHVAE